MSTMTYNWDDAWMMPNGDCMIFCSDRDGLAPVELEIDIETDGPGAAWAIAEVRMIEPKDYTSSPQKKRVISGELRGSAVAWIISTMRTDIETFIRENYVDPSLDYRDAVRSL